MIGVLVWQYAEYRSWSYGRRSYLLLKLGAPAVFIAMGLAASGIASSVSGMEALGVFYLGMFIALIAAPVSVAFLGPLFGIPFKDAAAISGSLFATLFALLWGVSMFLNAGGSVVNKNWDYEKQKHSRQESLKNPEPADDHVSITGSRFLRDSCRECFCFS